MFVRKDAGKFILDPQAVYDQLCSGLSDSQLQLQELLSALPNDQIKQDAERLQKLRGTPTGLTPWEQTNAQKYSDMLTEKGAPLKEQVFAVNQNPERVFKASNGGVLPAFTTADKHLWIAERNRALHPAEKFIGHSYPMTAEQAAALKIPVAQLVKAFPGLV